MLAETEAVAEEITGDMLHDTINNCLFLLLEVHKVRGSHTEHVFKGNTHTNSPSK
jgi:hypothetical protein